MLGPEGHGGDNAAWSHRRSLLAAILMPSHSVLVLLAQLAVVLALSRGLGALFLRLRQPQVMGEMLAGIALGPSLLGLLWPAAHAALFPPESIPVLNALSQVGVILFLFLIGLELDPGLLRGHGRAAVAISVASIAVPFVLGMGLTVYLYGRGFFTSTDPDGSRWLASALFMGAAMGVTAFPVLARILTERNLHRTNAGGIAIACAAFNDVAAWVLLAFVVAVANASGTASAVRTAGLSAAYVAIMFLVVRPFLARLRVAHERKGPASQWVLAVVLLLVLASAIATEAIGIHAMFGAFVMGAVMPRGTAFSRALVDKLEDFTVVLLLPLFFAYTGLRTRLELLSSMGMWLDALLVVAVACLGKLGGAAGAARLCGMSWRESSTIGVLMNTRGLMELVILSAGLALGVISEPVFGMMVVMAIATTAFTTPLLHLIYPPRLFEAAADVPPADRAAGILIPVANPLSGVPLLRLAALLKGPADSRPILALHLRRVEAHEAYHAAGSPAPSDAAEDPAITRAAAHPATVEQDADVLSPLVRHAAELGVAVEPLTVVGRSLSAAMARVVRERRVELVLMGFHRPVLSRTILGGSVHQVLEGVAAEVGVFVDRGMGDVKQVLVPYLGGEHDRAALELAQRIGRAAGAQITVLHVISPDRAGAPLGAGEAVDRVFSDPTQPAQVRMRVVHDASPVDAVVREAAGVDLIVIGLGEQWGLEHHSFGLNTERIVTESAASLLIARGRHRT